MKLVEIIILTARWVHERRREENDNCKRAINLQWNQIQPKTKRKQNLWNWKFRVRKLTIEPSIVLNLQTESKHPESKPQAECSGSDGSYRTRTLKEAVDASSSFQKISGDGQSEWGKWRRQRREGGDGGTGGGVEEFSGGRGTVTDLSINDFRDL